MNREEFEADLLREGYRVTYAGLRANEALPEHGHDFDVRILVIGGEITLTRDGRTETYRLGESCSLTANTPHGERAGPQGVAFVVGRRPVKA
jgi:quercetin dioxygenase-like cupin family protein